MYVRTYVYNNGRIKKVRQNTASRENGEETYLRSRRRKAELIDLGMHKVDANVDGYVKATAPYQTYFAYWKRSTGIVLIHSYIYISTGLMYTASIWTSLFRMNSSMRRVDLN